MNKQMPVAMHRQSFVRPSSLAFLLLSFYLLLTQGSFAQVLQAYTDCINPTLFLCGSENYNISYPFLAGNRPRNCGDPSYELNCSNNDLTINIDGKTYLVKDIGYETRVLTVAHMDSSVDTCSLPFGNTTLDWSLFRYTNQDINLTLYNCSPSSISLFFVDCPNSNPGWNWYYHLGETIPPLPSGSDCNSSVFVPLLQQQAAKLTNGFQLDEFTQVLQEGFEVEWTGGGDWCNRCMESGGACGHNSSNPSEQICYCSNGTRTGSCSSKGSSTSKMILIGVFSLLGFVIFVGSCWLWCRRREKLSESYKQKKEQEQVLFPHNESSGPLASTEFFFMDIAALQAATENFSEQNKLGEGGFGPVYGGMLPPDGKQIAVKRLSSTSTQGFMEFKNEVKSIAKLQHRNLVRLLGCCIERNEKLLVYEYLPNQSLNNFIFDSEKRSLLDWSKRLRIIIGITRGLIYLHEDSRLKIIHRDLKPGNILLDHEMNPKISDFGLARIFSKDENEANTNRVVGTYGYMAPEFAMDGMFSVKSDVYSFGILLLEIISGNKNGRSHFLQFERSLPDHAWELWEQEKGVELIDKLMVFSCPVSEILRCIHIGLLCVQENAIDRPAMSMVLHMMQTEQMVLKEPKKPPSFIRSMRERNTSSCLSKIPSNNELTLTSIPGR